MLGTRSIDALAADSIAVSTLAIDGQTRPERRKARRGLLIKGLALVALIAGCGAKLELYPVHGKVTRKDGKPLVGGIVIFESEEPKGMTAEGIIGEDGSYSLKTLVPKDLPREGAVAGKHRVMISPAVKQEGLKKYEEVIDERYLEFEASGLTATIDAKPEGATVDFLNLDPPRR